MMIEESYYQMIHALNKLGLFKYTNIFIYEKYVAKFGINESFADQ